MPTQQTRKRRFPIDRQISNLRWLLFLFAAIVVLSEAFVSPGGILGSDETLPTILILITAALYNVAVMLLLAYSSASHLLPVVTLALDTLLTLGLILSSGGLASPLLFFALFPLLTAVIRFSQPLNLLIGLAMIISFGGTVYLMSLPSSWSEARPLIVFCSAMLLATVVGSFVSEETRRVSARDHQNEIERKRRQLRAAREHSRLTFELASTLSATLNYNKVLRAVLEVGEKGMQELGPERASQMGAVLLFAHNDLRIAASSHLSPRDRNVVFEGKEGALANALTKAEAVVVDEPIEDPELGRLISLHTCRQAIVVPLRAGFESFGAVIFGNSEPDIYSEDLVNLLTAICNQAIVALQNAQLYQDLREEKERIVSIEEDARKKLARNLHDGPTQNVASIAMQISFVRKLMENAKNSDQISEELQRVEALARRTTKQIRHMLFTLRPIILETQGLEAALEQYVNKLTETYETRIDLEADPRAEETLDQDTQGIIFYIVEEAISNARKHAEADRIWIRLYLQGRSAFVAEIEDNGVGFDVDAVQTTYDSRGSLGLINMHERAEMTNGELSITSAPGQGTQIRLTIPLREGV